jgi:CheY-like chemotaxis protein
MTFLSILRAISDERSFALFKAIATGSSSDSIILISKLKLTSKQYYSRLSYLLRADLIRRKKGKYCLTSMGKVFYDLQITAENAVNNYWKLKAIDSFEEELYSKEEYQRVLDSIIDNNNLKEILIKQCSYSPKTKKLITQKSPLLLPIDYQQQQQHQQEIPYPSSSPPSSQRNIMLVDDEPDTLLTYKTFLVNKGYNVDAFTDSYEALKHFISLNYHYYDLVIADIRMPGLNGLQLYQKIKSIDDTANVIFVSALDPMQELVSLFPDLDFSNNIIRKPVDYVDFLDKIKKVLLLT